MAVAVKNTPETTTRQPLDSVAVGGLLGALYVLGSLALVFWVIPTLWGASLSAPITSVLGSFIDAALLLLVMLAAGVGLAFLGQRLVGPAPPPGLKAGIFSSLVGLLVIGFLTRLIGVILEGSLGEGTATTGIAITGAAGVGLLALGFWYMLHPAYKRFLIRVEEQGWFSTTAYKRSQGQRVRRGTILGILVLAGCGVYTLLAHKSLETGLSRHWQVSIPFSGGWSLILLPDVQFTVPILLTLASLWLAFRVVNYPVFADFLIATEAEMNKVSWTTRKRLVQDTTVVLVTVVLITVFLFVVDVLWGWGLTRIGILQVPERTEQVGRQVDW